MCHLCSRLQIFLRIVIAECDHFGFYRAVVIEIWEQAILPYNLPLTLALSLVIIYWLISLFGIVGIDSIDIDLDTDPDLDTDLDSSSHIPGPVASSLRFVNATDVPVFAVLSILITVMWVISMIANYYINPEHTHFIGIAIFLGNFIISVILVKIITTPLAPVFRKLKEHEKAEPAVGGIATVISKEVDAKYGQCEQKRTSGAPAILTCITSEEKPILRGTEVTVVAYDKEKGIYNVRTL